MAHNYYHSTSVQAAKIAKQENVKKLCLSHISARYMGNKAKKLESQAKKVFPNTILVNDFDQINIPMEGSENEIFIKK